MRGTHQPTAVPCRRKALRPRSVPPLLRRQRGAFAIMAAGLIFFILGLCGFAIDLSRMYNRKAELQTAVDAIAMAAAAQLDGTKDGVERAIEAAENLGGRFYFNYTGSSVDWSSGAIRIGPDPHGSEWVDPATVLSDETAKNLLYVKIDTRELDAFHTEVELLLLRILPGMQSTTNVNSSAIAGRSSIDVVPFAICAMSESAGSARGAELVEYGFRRGISYDLMKLNPDSATSGATFLVNPIAPAGTNGTAMMDRMDFVRPFVCAGKMHIPGLSGGTITVEPGFPLASLYEQLNSRFGTYTAPCTSNGAPPDTNVKPFTRDDFPWMNDRPLQAAASKSSGSKLLTIADLTADEIRNLTPAATADMYGPLWVYAKAARFSSYREGEPEPPSGYSTFTATTSNWATLYTPASPRIKAGNSYPSATPYKDVTTPPPGGLQGIPGRRVLNIPLLRCPVAAGSPAAATVVGIGKFFMTVPATDRELYAEFAGGMKASTAGKVELYR